MNRRRLARHSRLEAAAAKSSWNESAVKCIIQRLAADLVRSRVAVIATPGSTPAALAAKAATTEIHDAVKLGLLFFHRDGDGAVRRKANLLAFDIGNQVEIDEMMVPLVPAFTAV